MRPGYPVIILLLLTAIAVFFTGCTQNTQTVAPATTALPTVTETPTIVATASVCGVENCHGFAVQCGPNPVTTCSANNVADDLNAEDQCRKYASCQIIDGSCQVVKQTKYDKCVSCVNNCKTSFPNNPNQEIDCSQSC